MSGMLQKRGHREAQVTPLSVMEGSEKPDRRRAGEMGTEGQDIEGSVRDRSSFTCVKQ